MLDRTLALTGLALALFFGFMPYWAPEMPTWIALAGSGLGILLFGFACGLAFTTYRTDGGDNLQHLIQAFERHAAEENFLATRLTQDIPLPTRDISSAKHTFDRTLLTVEERDKWRGCLKHLAVQCSPLGLVNTQDAIKDAVARFDDSEINRVTAYWAYHAVSLALKNEIARKGHFVTLKNSN